MTQNYPGDPTAKIDQLESFLFQNSWHLQTFVFQNTWKLPI